MPPRRFFFGALTALIFGGLVACSGVLPNSAFSRHSVRYIGALDDSTPIPAVIRDRGIRVPDLATSVPISEQLYTELARSDDKGRYAGITYDLTRGNRLAADWIVQTPNRWGHRARDLPFYALDCKTCDPDVLLPACSSDADCPGGGTCGDTWPLPGTTAGAARRVCFGHSDELVVRIHDLVASARHRVDVTLLQPAPDTRFLGGLHAALLSLAFSHREVVARFLIGQYPPDGSDAGAFLKKLTAGLSDIPDSHLSVSVSAMRTCIVFEDCDSYSWNHSKIVTVDGSEALVGGHNQYSADYLVDAPVHDLSMRVSGPAAASAARFADELWRYVCANRDKAPAVAVATLPAGQTVPNTDCLTQPPLPSVAKPAAGGVPILAVGRLGAGITTDFADQSELARDLMLGAAQHEIRIVQQDLGFGLGRADVLFPDSTIDRLVDFLRRKEGDIYIVLSNYGAVGNVSTYSNDVTLRQLALHLRDAVQDRVYAHDPLLRYEIRNGPDPVNAMLCSRVHLAPIRFGPDARWPGGEPIGNHAKFWMVDERAFYIGSDNMYPVNLQEYGYIVDDHQAAEEITNAYWKPLWEWSSKAAVSGPEVKDCIFREVPNH